MEDPIMKMSPGGMLWEPRNRALHSDSLWAPRAWARARTFYPDEILSGRTPRSRRGLTRLELVIILVIVLVVGGWVITFISKQRELANQNMCANNLRRIGAAMLGFHEEKKFLPAARLAPGYATWGVQIVAHLQKDSDLVDWDLAKRFAEQSTKARTALVAPYLCPARPRSTWESTPGAGPDDSWPGALGDYACASGDGDPKNPWAGELANGAIILGKVLEEKGGLILRWEGRTTLASLVRGQSYTFLVGDKHVPLDNLGQSSAGDGAFYNGALPDSCARIGGPGHGIAPSPVAPFTTNFGSAHDRICVFLHADGSAHAYANSLSEEVLGRMIRRQ